jgi:lipopolysaccharide export system protein LptA
MVNSKKYFGFFLIVFVTFFLNAEKTTSVVDPFEKIIITSNNAKCAKRSDGKKMLTLSYYDNVLVTFADQSNISAQELNIYAETTQTNTQQIPPIKEIKFKKNVILQKDNKIIKAENAVINLSSSLCTLTDKVSVEQKKTAVKDIPFNTKSNFATFNWKTNEISLTGNTKTPVCTTIELGSNPKFIKKKK